MMHASPAWETLTSATLALGHWRAHFELSGHCRLQQALYDIYRRSTSSLHTDKCITWLGDGDVNSGFRNAAASSFVFKTLTDEALGCFMHMLVSLVSETQWRAGLALRHCRVETCEILVNAGVAFIDLCLLVLLVRPWRRHHWLAIDTLADAALAR